MKISEFARASGVGIETIRYYQRRNLLPVPSRYPGSPRRYPDVWVRDVQQIRGLQAVGLSLDEIRLLLRSPAPECADMQQTLARHIQATRAELARLKHRLRRLQAALPGCAEGPGRRGQCGLACLLGPDGGDPCQARKSVGSASALTDRS
ncbi:MAG: MerR family transcriptional regulator [Castellaniella sp.]|uniref:MerR family transcriptional regulator n=1 Tax=Castellaniella sp. TaxID=1955812 RepID=UPI003C717874